MKISKDSGISKAFASRFEGKPVIDITKLREGGSPLFTKDQVNETPYPLDRIIRAIIVDNHISKEYFSERAKTYAKLTLGIHQTKVGNYKSNILKTLKKGNISIRKFFEIVHHILGFPISDIKVNLATDENIRSYHVNNREGLDD